MPLIAELLSAEPTSARAARRAVSEAMGDVLQEDDLASAVLCTSEVVTNALEHGDPPIELVIADTGDRLHIEVRDGSPQRPKMGKNPSPSDIRGRGLVILDRCADRWGVDDLHGGRKAVWFELDISR